MLDSFNLKLIAICSFVFIAFSAFFIFNFVEKSHSESSVISTMHNFENSNQIISSEPNAGLAQKSNYSPKIEKKSSEPVMASLEPKSRISELEGKQFELRLSGEALISGMSKKANLSVKIEPEKGTNLKQFIILDSRFLLDGMGVNTVLSKVALSDNVLALDFLRDDGQSFTVMGELDSNIVSDTNDKQTVTIKNQKFYFGKKDIPYTLDLIGTLIG